MSQWGDRSPTEQQLECDHADLLREIVQLRMSVADLLVRMEASERAFVDVIAFNGLKESE